MRRTYTGGFKNSFFSIARNVRFRTYRVARRHAHEILARIHKKQRTQFSVQSQKFSSQYARVRGYSLDGWVTPIWSEYRKALEDILLPYPSFSFLAHPMFLKSFFATAGGRWMRHELTFLQKYFQKSTLKRILTEDYVGDPLLLNDEYQTSHHAIHLLYHLARYEDATGHKVANFQTIVEWGGGYGKMASLLRRLNKKSTIIIVDLPLISCLQWLYLTSIFGEREVVLFTSEKAKVKSGKIHIVPLPFVRQVPSEAALFLSTWAISESSRMSQDYVANTNWFGASRLLLGYHDNNMILPHSEHIAQMAMHAGAQKHDIHFLSHDHYMFR